MNLFKSQTNVKNLWVKAEPKNQYDTIIVGGGAMGLATAYYLSQEHEQGNIALLEWGDIGNASGNRPAELVRANYMIPGNTEYYDFCLQLWEGLAKELNRNIMFAQRGVIDLLYQPDEVNHARYRGNIMRLNGIDVEYLALAELKRLLQHHVDFSEQARFQIIGGLLQARAGYVNPMSVVLSLAEHLPKQQVDICEQCGVTELLWRNRKIIGVRTERGDILASKVFLAMADGGVSLGLEQVFQQLKQVFPFRCYDTVDLVTESVGPKLDPILRMQHQQGLLPSFYLGQGDDGGFFMGSMVEDVAPPLQHAAHKNDFQQQLMSAVLGGVVGLVPYLGELQLLRRWSEKILVSWDGSPVIDELAETGLYLAAGFGTAWFQSVLGGGYCMAHLLARGVYHEKAESYKLNRFQQGQMLWEQALPQHYWTIE